MRAPGLGVGPALSQRDGRGLAAQGWFATALAHNKEAPVAYTGQSLKRFEDPRLLTGQGAFLDDLTFPEMLYAAVLRSPHAHATIRAIDTAAARHAPGVVAVITAEDLEGVIDWMNRACPKLRIVPPQCKQLACGDVGVGAMADLEMIGTAVYGQLAAGINPAALPEVRRWSG